MARRPGSSAAKAPSRRSGPTAITTTNSRTYGARRHRGRSRSSSRPTRSASSGRPTSAAAAGSDSASTATPTGPRSPSSARTPTASSRPPGWPPSWTAKPTRLAQDGPRDFGGTAPGHRDAGAAVTVVVPQHAVAERLGFQPHLRPQRPQADSVAEDLHPAQAGFDGGASGHDSRRYLGLRVRVPLPLF